MIFSKKTPSAPLHQGCFVTPVVASCSARLEPGSARRTSLVASRTRKGPSASRSTCMKVGNEGDGRICTCPSALSLSDALHLPILSVSHGGFSLSAHHLLLCPLWHAHAQHHPTRLPAVASAIWTGRWSRRKIRAASLMPVHLPFARRKFRA
jgi:hypothetical protein